MASALLALVLAGGLLAAQKESASFDVPFGFKLDDAEMPAGRYEILNDRDWSVLWVCADGVRCSVVQSSRNKQMHRAEGQLVFVEDDGGHRLVFVQIRPGLGYRLPNCPKVDGQDAESEELVTISAEGR
jgi:hypothetical protein